MIQEILAVGFSSLQLPTEANAMDKQRLARAVDQAWIPWKNVVVGFSLGLFGLENLLLWRQYGVLKRTIRPKALTAEIDQETFDKSQVRPPMYILMPLPLDNNTNRHTVAPKPSSASSPPPSASSPSSL
jgi:hypothetical protein